MLKSDLNFCDKHSLYRMTFPNRKPVNLREFLWIICRISFHTINIVNNIKMLKFKNSLTNRSKPSLQAKLLSNEFSESKPRKTTRIIMDNSSLLLV